jgi:hypothetical protein
MVQTRFLFFAFTLFTAAACTSAVQEDTNLVVGDKKPTPLTSITEPIWKPTSTRIELSSFGYFEGSTAYAKDRTDLTPAQATALEGIRALPPPGGRPASDYTSYEVRITDQDGTVARYRAANGNVHDSDESTAALALPTLDYATLEPFLGTFRCLTAKEVPPTPRTTDVSSHPSSLDVSKAVTLPNDTGCTNGVFVPYSCSDSLLRLEVAKPTTYDLLGGSCREKLSLRVYGADPSVALAESTPGTPDACFSLRHTFEPGSYLLVLSKTNASGCAAGGTAGDTSLRLQLAK